MEYNDVGQGHRIVNMLAHLNKQGVNGKPNAKSVCFEKGDSLDVSHCGFDYKELGNTDFAYFNLCYYTPIKHAINQHLKKIYFRIAAEKVKKKRGCNAEETLCYVKSYNSQIEYALNVYQTRKYLIEKQ